MDALNRGTLVHDTLEKWVNAREAGGPSDLDSLEEILRHEAKILKKNYGTFLGGPFFISVLSTHLWRNSVAGTLSTWLVSLAD